MEAEYALPGVRTRLSFQEAIVDSAYPKAPGNSDSSVRVGQLSLCTCCCCPPLASLARRHPQCFTFSRSHEGGGGGAIKGKEYAVGTSRCTYVFAF